MGLAVLNFESAFGVLPKGADARPSPASPSFPHTLYRWSTFAAISPYLENGTTVEQLDLSKPLYGADFQITPEHRPAASITVPVFLCPSDRGLPVADNLGPINYAACTGSGVGGGTPFETDGVFHINSDYRLAEIKDGTSKTLAMSESLLGDGAESFGGTVETVDPQTAYGFVYATPLTETACAAARTFNVTNRRGFAWVNGEYRCGLYNQFFLPNDRRPDCIAPRLVPDPAERLAAFGWRTARSRHPGGIQAVAVDGAVHWFGDDVDTPVWRAVASRAGSEVSGIRLGRR